MPSSYAHPHALTKKRVQLALPGVEGIRRWGSYRTAETALDHIDHRPDTLGEDSLPEVRTFRPFGGLRTKLWIRTRWNSEVLFGRRPEKPRLRESLHTACRSEPGRPSAISLSLTLTLMRDSPKKSRVGIQGQLVDLMLESRRLR